MCICMCHFPWPLTCSSHFASNSIIIMAIEWRVRVYISPNTRTVQVHSQSSDCSYAQYIIHCHVIIMLLLLCADQVWDGSWQIQAKLCSSDPELHDSSWNNYSWLRWEVLLSYPCSQDTPTSSVCSMQVSLGTRLPTHRGRESLVQLHTKAIMGYSLCRDS